MVSDKSITTTQPRPITLALLDDFEKWTREAPMFLSSPQGAAFAIEMREVFALARTELEIGEALKRGYAENG